MIADVDFGLVRCLDYGKEFSARPLEANGLYIAIRNYLFSSTRAHGYGVFIQNQRDWFFGKAVFKSIFHKKYFDRVKLLCHQDLGNTLLGVFCASMDAAMMAGP